MPKANIDKAVQKATVRTINTLLRKGRVAASKRVRQVYNIKSKDLNKYIKVRKANYSNMEGKIIVRGKPIPLFLFGAKQTKRGVTVRVKRDSGRKLIPGAFIATMKSGRTNVFERITKKRLPIRQFFAPGPVKMFEIEGAKEFDQLLKEDAHKTLKRDVAFYIGKEIGKGGQTYA